MAADQCSQCTSPPGWHGDCPGCPMRQGFLRYEKLRLLNVQQFADLFKAHLSSGKTFDQMVDELQLPKDNV